MKKFAHIDAIAFIENFIAEYGLWQDIIDHANISGTNLEELGFSVPDMTYDMDEDDEDDFNDLV